MYKNIISLFCFFITRNVQSRNKSKMVEMDTHTYNGVVFLWNISAFLLLSAWMKIFPGSYNFADTHAIVLIPHSSLTLHGDTPVLHATHKTYMAFPLVIILFTLGKKVYILLCHPCNLRGMSKESSITIKQKGINLFYMIWLVLMVCPSWVILYLQDRESCFLYIHIYIFCVLIS